MLKQILKHNIIYIVKEMYPYVKMLLAISVKNGSYVAVDICP